MKIAPDTHVVMLTMRIPNIDGEAHYPDYYWYYSGHHRNDRWINSYIPGVDLWHPGSYHPCGLLPAIQTPFRMGEAQSKTIKINRKQKIS